jgi:xylose isomerase
MCSGAARRLPELFNTDMKRELDHLARFSAHGGRLRQRDRLHRAIPDRAEAEGTDQAPVRFGRRRLHQLSCAPTTCCRHFKLNIETNHATLAGHTMMHELDYAGMQGALGSIDANTGDLLLGGTPISSRRTTT